MIHVSIDKTNYWNTSTLKNKVFGRINIFTNYGSIPRLIKRIFLIVVISYKAFFDGKPLVRNFSIVLITPAGNHTECLESIELNAICSGKRGKPCIREKKS